MNENRTGRFLGLPYDWRSPTLARLKARLWNPRDPHIFTPKVFGWGYTLNLYQLARRLGIVRRPPAGPGSRHGQ